jgi:DNA-binding response OmpR family regulator
MPRISAAGGREGLDLQKMHKPEIALVDIGLLNEDGLSVMADIKGQSPGTLVFAMTGLPDFDKEPAYQKANLDGLLKKPFSMQQVLDLVKGCVLH